MTYPPNNPGYPPQQPNQFSAPNQAPNPQYNRAPERIPAAAPGAPAGPSNLPKILTAAVAVLGLLVFGFSFADPYGFKDSSSGFSAPPRDLLTFLPAIAAVAAALLAGVDLLPKQKNFKAWTAILSVLGLLLAIVEIAQVPSVPQLPPVVARIVQSPGDLEVKWGLYAVLVFAVLQAGSALAALLLDAGVIKPPAPKPQVDPYGYGAPGQYYGQPTGQPGGAPQHAPQHSQGRSDYGQQYGQPGGYQQPTGGYPGARPQHAPADESSPVTPATGFPAFGQASAAGAPAGGAESGYPGGAAASAEPTQTFQQQAPQQSDPASS